jgi:hypothetical protein
VLTADAQTHALHAQQKVSAFVRENGYLQAGTGKALVEDDLADIAQVDHESKHLASAGTHDELGSQLGRELSEIATASVPI